MLEKNDCVRFVGKKMDKQFRVLIKLILIVAATSSSAVFAQKNVPIPWKGMYIIQDSGALIHSDCLFCNPETMKDRILLDSTKKMIARRTSNPYGYTYYEWRNKEYSKTYEEIQVWPLKFKSAQYITDSGTYSPKEKNTFTNSYISYFRAPYNKKEPYNGKWTADRIQIQLTQRATDSIAKLYNNLKDSIGNGAILWSELNFHENGKIKSTGIIMFPGMGLKKKHEMKTPSTIRYKIGLWLYYDGSGRLYYKDYILKPIKTL